MTYKKQLSVTLLSVLFLSLSGCADSVTFEQAATTEPVGFLHGLWHGVIIYFSFLMSLIWDDVAVYAIYNNGGWYDFGFCLATSSVFGGSIRTGR